MKVEIRKQRVTDAKRFFEIINRPEMTSFASIMPKDVEAEKEFLRGNAEKRKKNIEHNYAILADGKVVGGCGIKIDQHRKYIGEIGYFVDSEFWGKGIATKATKLVEKLGFKELGLLRISIIMNVTNPASEKVAINAGYIKEGLMKKAIKENERLVDVFLYAKTK